MSQTIDTKLLETFIYDCERLFLLSFDNTEYEINQTCLTVRKLLIDTPGIMVFWNFFFQEKFKLCSANSDEKFNTEQLENLKLYIPLLDILPYIIITNYTSIKLEETQEATTYSVKCSEIKINLLSIDKYLTEDFLVLDHTYITRKDILEYIAYGTGVIHYNIRKDKIDRIKAVNKLNFNYTMGYEKPDSMLFLSSNYRTYSDEVILRGNPNYTNFLIMLGNRHSFESLMTLQIIHEIRASQHLILLYEKAKEYIIENVFKYKNYDRNKYFTTSDIERKSNKI